MADSDEFSEKLIDTVSDYPALYDKSCRDYKDIKIKDNIWLEIASKLGSETDVVIRKWRSLRDSYSRKLREIQNVKSGQSSKKSIPYKFQNQMNFLEGYLKRKSTTSNFPDAEADQYSEAEVEEDAQSSGSKEQTIPSATPGKRKPERADPLVEPILEYLNSKRTSRDPDELWLLSLAPTLRRLNDYQKVQAKIRMQQCLMEIEFGSGSQQSTPVLYPQSTGPSYYQL